MAGPDTSSPLADSSSSGTHWTFEPDLAYQRRAVDAVVGLFRGQDAAQAQFTVHARPQAAFDADVMGEDASELGIGNRLRLDQDAILSNLHRVQNATGLLPEDSLESMNFTVEMETGTGKTYVYLRTVYELNAEYGFTKFVIVVPSVAIKEGVETSIRQLKGHFASLYGNPVMQHFQYSSADMSKVRGFAVSESIQIMVVTVAAINKATNNIYKPDENLGGEKAIDLIRATRPILIIDEPQSVYGDQGLGARRTGAGRKALEGFNALATLRYSATHPKSDKANLVYRLDAIAAHDQRLVKQIEVDSLETEVSATLPYIKLVSTLHRAGTYSAKVEVDREIAGRTTRRTITVRVGDNLADTTGLERYRQLDVENIGAGTPGWIRLSTLAAPLVVGEAHADDITTDERARSMIARTIRQHLAKEVEFAEAAKRGAAKIKVLSLFFVDTVAKYRLYEEGEAQPGEYARIFEEEYAKIAAESQYSILRTSRAPAEVAAGAHQGYFAIDRKKSGDTLVDAGETTETGRQQAGLAYEQIMKSKEWLTTPGTPIRFIFTHSALQEGWDNPNVFQICVLRNLGTERWRRQSVGRGLRLAVDATGNRVKGPGINRLTVIANESFSAFAEGYQRDLAEDLGMVFGIVARAPLAALTFTRADAPRAVVPVGSEAAGTLVTALLSAGHIDSAGKVQDSLRRLVRDDYAGLEKLVEPHVDPEAVGTVCGAIRRVARPIDIKDVRERHRVPVVTKRLESPEFQALWERIKHRTVFFVEVSEADLREALVAAVREMAPIPRRKAAWIKTAVQIDSMGVGEKEGWGSEERADVEFADERNLPDILTVLADKTSLTRATLARVLRESGKLDQFCRNPQRFIDEVSSTLNTAKTALLVDGIKFEVIADDRPDADRWYSQSIFTEDELSGYLGLGGNIVGGYDPADGAWKPRMFGKSVFENVVFDSLGERQFALDLEANSSVKLFAKLPDDFKIPTPLGSYNPDWAVVIDHDGAQRVYFVVETKGTTDKAELPTSQRQKINSALRHFEAVREATGHLDLVYPNQPVVSVADLDMATHPLVHAWEVN